MNSKGTGRARVFFLIIFPNVVLSVREGMDEKRHGF